MVYIITSKTRKSRLPHGRTVVMRSKDGERVHITDERDADKRLGRLRRDWDDPEPIPGYTENQKP